ncbi:cupin domain-containing protein [Allopusillimonas ginsengisoli]|uniref:cupin domain-containing protein n=1 Tax=Allopusillimonas ginsengisoli TaxID=453575 RepID=UPI00101EBBBD|nr:cupin domain-containing protein [Allopusillimonas ginsengisoli]TEA76914.1 hypothetical protein ERE07_17900 [Allopusillimonas ginsengisoli]
MTVKLKRVVTTINGEGKSIFVDDASVMSTVTGGMKIHNIWGTSDGIPQVGRGIEAEAVPFPFFPGPGGHRVVLAEFTPEMRGTSGKVEAKTIQSNEAEEEKSQPGLLGVFEEENPGFHTTDTIDYAICIEGEVWLVLDDQERLITPGTVVIQRGTRHAWQNRSDHCCVMLFVLLGAERA